MCFDCDRPFCADHLDEERCDNCAQNFAERADEAMFSLYHGGALTTLDELTDRARKLK
jgi:hypothetical protein